MKEKNLCFGDSPKLWTGNHHSLKSAHKYSLSLVIGFWKAANQWQS